MPTKANYGKTAIDVKYLIIMGDSSSDRGTVFRKKLLGCIPMSSISGLKGHSPNGRFTNGLAWDDHFVASIASDFTIKRLEKKWSLDDTDIADAIITRDQRILDAIFTGYFLDDDKFVNYRSQVWVRTYCEGGLMAHDYSWKLSTNPKRFFSRIILPTLEDMRKKILHYDESKQITAQHKSETLIIEWSGANDLITVNAKPSIEEVDKAIIARVDNVKQLIANGYRNFILINLPNLALIPRFQAESKESQDLAAQCSAYFNAELANACAQLSLDYPHCAVDVFDANSLFTQIYSDPEKYYFEKSKLKIAYIDSDDFDEPSDGLSPATGYMFYDKEHGSADTQALLSSFLYIVLSKSYELLEPDKQICKKRKELSEAQLLITFRLHYQRCVAQHKPSFFSCVSASDFDYQTASVEEIVKEAMLNKKSTCRKIMVELGWMCKDGTIILDCNTLKCAEAKLNKPASISSVAF